MNKILVVTSYFYPDVSGVGKHMYNLCKCLVSDYHFKVVIISSGKKYQEEEISGIKVYRLPFWFKLSNTPINPLWYFHIKKIIAREKPDLINSRAPVPFMPDLGALAAGKIPFVLGYHFPSMIKGKILPDILIKIYESLFLRFMLNKAKVIICSSEFIGKSFLKNYSHKIVTITQGIDTRLFIPKETNVRNEIIFVGNFYVEYKGLFYLLQALRFVKDHIKEIKLKIVGEGNYKYYHSLCKKIGINRFVEFKGRLFGKNLVGEYQTSNLLVLPSISDNFPSVCLEAMACKIPVIGTAVGAVKDIIDDGKSGILVPPRDEKALANAIIRILRDKKLADSLEQKGYRKIQDNFNWDDRARMTKEVFDKVIRLQ